jgi:hypothetical protein
MLTECRRRAEEDDFYRFKPSVWLQFRNGADTREPGPARLTKLIAQAKREGIRVVFVEPEFSQQAADAVAEAIGGQVVTIDPLAEDWPAGMQAIARGLAKALGSGGDLEKLTYSMK